LRPLRYDEVHLEPDQLGRQVGQPVDPTLRISIVDDNILALNPPELAQPLPERVEQGRPIGRGRHPKKTYARHLSRLLRVGGERHGEKGEGEDDCERIAYDPHAATAVCWLSTVAIFRQTSIRRNLICPLATRLKSRTSAASSVGNEPCVFTRRRNSSWSRSIVFVVRSVFHWARGNRKNVSSSSPPSRRLVTTPGHRLLHVRSKAAYAVRAVSAFAA